MADGRPTVKLAVTGTRQQDGLSVSFRAISAWRSPPLPG